MTQPLVLANLWRDTQAAVQRDFGTYFTIAAAFVLLPQVALAQYGPPPPTTTAGLTPQVMIWLLLVPTIIGSLAQLAIVRLLLAPGTTVGSALRAALLALPMLLLALFAVALPLGIGFLAAVLPGLYLLGRLALMLPVAATEGRTPFALIERSWALTHDNGWRAAAFIGSVTLLTMAGGVLAAGLGAALGSVLTLALSKGVGLFGAALVQGLASAGFAVLSAAASATLYRHLTRTP